MTPWCLPYCKRPGHDAAGALGLKGSGDLFVLARIQRARGVDQRAAASREGDSLPEQSPLQDGQRLPFSPLRDTTPETAPAQTRVAAKRPA